MSVHARARVDGSNMLKAELSFPKTPDKAKDRKELSRKFEELLRQESFPIKKMEFGILRAKLERKKALLIFSFQNPISVAMAIRNPEKNIVEMNAVFNKVSSYLNTILGNLIIDGKVSVSREVLFKKEAPSLVQALFNISMLAKINEKLKKTFEPLSIVLSHKSRDRESMVVSASFEKKNACLLITQYVLKEKIPWDLILAEKTELSKLEDDVKIIMEMRD